MKILVAALNWGIGHATRCLPIVRALENNGAEVILASDGQALDVFKRERPDLLALELPGYDVKYWSDNFVLAIGTQAFKIARAVSNEQRALEAYIQKYQIDAVISDNRYGLHSKNVPCVLISHQLKLQAPWPFGLLANAIAGHYIQKFNDIWVPDVAGEPNLSGTLSHGTPYKQAVFLGPLSRFLGKGTSSENNTEPIDFLVVISGPEPQRTWFEEKVLAQAALLPQNNGVLVRGVPTDQTQRTLDNGFSVQGFAKSETLKDLMIRAERIICRSGYSTVMDLAALGKNAFFVPTPGQTEQEYLAKEYANKGISQTCSQKEFDLPTVLNISSLGTGFGEQADGGQLQLVVEEWMARVGR